jgi:hypothetical protein
MTSVLNVSLLRVDHAIQKLHHCTMIKLIVVEEGKYCEISCQHIRKGLYDNLSDNSSGFALTIPLLKYSENDMRLLQKISLIALPEESQCVEDEQD